jgi:hypothetical protein
LDRTTILATDNDAREAAALVKARGNLPAFDDPTLARVVVKWPELPEQVRRCILAMLNV